MKSIKLLVLFVFAVVLSATAFASDTVASAPIGSSVTFAVSADGTQPFTYQWSKGPVVIAGATSVNYAIPVVSVADAGTYTCKVSNSAGSTVSNNAVFSVTLIVPSNVIITFTKN